MSSDTVRIGFDYRGNTFYAARVESGQGRQEIKALLRLEPKHLGKHTLLKEGRAVMAVADSMIITKRFRLNDHPVEFRQRAVFEMAQMMLADEQEYYFDFIPTGWSDFHLGLALRKQHWESFSEELPAENGTAYFERGRSRAVCLAMGYNTFCRKVGGELVVLVDFSPESATLVLLYKNQIVETGTVNMACEDWENDVHRKKLFMECKTLLSYKISSLFEEGITIPPAKLLVTGLPGNSRLGELNHYFSIDTTFPEINPGYLTTDTALAQEKISRYVIPLGAALE